MFPPRVAEGGASSDARFEGVVKDFPETFICVFVLWPADCLLVGPASHYICLASVVLGSAFSFPEIFAKSSSIGRFVVMLLAHVSSHVADLYAMTSNRTEHAFVAGPPRIFTD